MIYSLIILTIVSITFISIGVLFQNESLIRKDIIRQNKFQGTKSDITKEAIRFRKISGLVMIIPGIGLLIFGFILLPWMSNILGTS